MDQVIFTIMCQKCIIDVPRHFIIYYLFQEIEGHKSLCIFLNRGIAVSSKKAPLRYLVILVVQLHHQSFNKGIDDVPIYPSMLCEQMKKDYLTSNFSTILTSLVTFPDTRGEKTFKTSLRLV